MAHPQESTGGQPEQGIIPTQATPPSANKAAPRTQQPQATHDMSVVAGGGNRNVKDLPMDTDGRLWSNGLCDCGGDIGTFCLACWCPCIVYAHNKQRLEHLTNHGTPDPEHGGGNCSPDCQMHGLITTCFGAGWVLQLTTRGLIRSRYRIKGDSWGDCCMSLWCNPCELTQGSKELGLEEQSFDQQ